MNNKKIKIDKRRQKFLVLVIMFLSILLFFVSPKSNSDFGVDGHVGDTNFALLIQNKLDDAIPIPFLYRQIERYDTTLRTLSFYGLLLLIIFLTIQWTKLAYAGKNPLNVNRIVAMDDKRALPMSSFSEVDEEKNQGIFNVIDLDGTPLTLRCRTGMRKFYNTTVPEGSCYFHKTKDGFPIKLIPAPQEEDYETAITH